MNFDKVYAWAIGIVLASAATGQLDTLQASVWKAQARVIYASRASAWASPRFFPECQVDACAEPNFRTNKNKNLRQASK
jgi:hypothetical protein